MFEALFNLLPQPLHPAVVHLPIALAVLAPIFALGALVAIKRGARVLRAWGIAAAMVAALAGSAFVALETGEQQEEAVEELVPDRALSQHEDAAQVFLALSLVVAGFAAAGLTSRRIGSVARVTAAVGTLVLVFAGYRVGHSGGQLVYTHGAASAYTASAGARSPGISGDAVGQDADEDSPGRATPPRRTDDQRRR